MSLDCTDRRLILESKLDIALGDSNKTEAMQFRWLIRIKKSDPPALFQCRRKLIAL
jgi:hypothetical protein